MIFLYIYAPGFVSPPYVLLLLVLSGKGCGNKRDIIIKMEVFLFHTIMTDEKSTGNEFYIYFGGIG